MNDPKFRRRMALIMTAMVVGGVALDAADAKLARLFASFFGKQINLSANVTNDNLIHCMIHVSPFVRHVREVH